MDLSTALTLLVTLLVGLACGAVAGAGAMAWRQRPTPVGAPDVPAADALDGPLGRALEQRAADQALVREGIDRLHDRLRDLEHERAAWQGQLHQQVLDVRTAAEGLRLETGALATALRRPQVRGRWGEMHLRRTVELAGLVEHCDFAEQVRLDDGARRPDLVVRLVGGRQVVVDAKVPLDAYLDLVACGPSTPADEVAGHLRRHARQVRAQVDALGAKAYWRALPETPEFVVLFVPSESCLAAALEADPELLEHAATRQVVVASPTTLIALLRTVAHGWTQQALTEQAREVHRLGRELHERLGTMTGHLDQVGRSLNAAVTHYNAMLGSLESRVLVSARRFRDLRVTEADLEPARPVAVRALEPGARRRAAEATDDDTPTVAV